MTTRTSGTGEPGPEGSGRTTDPLADETPTDGSRYGRPVADDSPTTSVPVSGAESAPDGPSATSTPDTPGATTTPAGSSGTSGSDGPGTTSTSDRPGATSTSDRPGATSTSDGPGASTSDGRSGTSSPDEGSHPDGSHPDGSAPDGSAAGGVAAGGAATGGAAEGAAAEGSTAEPRETSAPGSPGEASDPEAPVEEEEYRGPLDRDAVRRVVGATTAVIASGDRDGDHNVSVLAGSTCFVRVLDGTHLAFPDEGAEAHSALRSNLAEAPGIGMLLVGAGGPGGRRGLHVNGTAEVVPAESLREQHPDLPGEPVPGRATDVWVVVTVGDAYALDGDDVPPLGAASTPAPGTSGPASAGKGAGKSRRGVVLGALVVLVALALVGVAIAALLANPPATEAASPSSSSSAPPPVPAGPTGPPTLLGRVVDVPNPDTVVVDVGGTPVRVDVVGIEDTAIPACARPTSQAFARTTLAGRTVTLVPDPTLPPAAGTRAYVVLDTQLSYTDALINAGAAPASGPAQYRAVFDTEQRAAQRARLGMWGPPCVR